MKVSSINFNNTNCSCRKKEMPSFSGGSNSAKNEIIDIISAFLLEQKLLKERYVPIVKDPAIKSKIAAKNTQKNKIDIIY